MPAKLHGYDFYKSIGSPKFVLAPMVDQSELAWRKLGRNYGAQLTYTPMLHANNFVQDPTYRKNAIEYSEEDRPLIYQFCANSADNFINAAKYVENLCDAIDLNLGCPQAIAKRGHYGSYLQDEWELIREMLTTAVKELSVPVTAKIRVLSSVQLTVKYALMLQSCGISLLVVHGRQREQRGIYTGLADWNLIKAVKDALHIPVIANGNIQFYEDIQRCIDATGADGVMSAEGHLHNPGIFSGPKPRFIWDMALEYLNITIRHPSPISFIRGHIFKLLHHGLHHHPQIREAVATAKSVEDLIVAVSNLDQVCGPLNCSITDSYLEELPLKHWFCQPYIRPPARTGVNRVSTTTANETPAMKDDVNIVGQSPYAYVATQLSQPMLELRAEQKMKRKEARRLCKQNRDCKAKKIVEVCRICVNNQKGIRCEYDLCKTCCKAKRKSENRNCTGHVTYKADNVNQYMYMSTTD